MKQIGVLTSGGDCPGLNAAIRGVCRAGQEAFGMNFIGFRDGFRGLVYDRTMELESKTLSGILTNGGTILGTSRDKPHRMIIDGTSHDMTDAAVETYRRRHLDALVCIGGGGTQKIVLRLKKAGLNIVTLPKTIDNDIGGTDVNFGFDTAMNTVTDAIDRLHSTAMSHGRIIVVEVMGHRAGWIALSETLFRKDEAAALARTLPKDHVEILNPRDMLRLAVDTNAPPSALACVMTRSDYTAVWRGDGGKGARASVLVIDETLRGDRIVFLEGIIGLVCAVMNGKEGKVAELMRLLFTMSMNQDDLKRFAAGDSTSIADKYRLTFRPVNAVRGDKIDSFSQEKDLFLSAA